MRRRGFNLQRDPAQLTFRFTPAQARAAAQFLRFSIAEFLPKSRGDRAFIARGEQVYYMLKSKVRRTGEGE